jgi:hypothetical protein
MVLEAGRIIAGVTGHTTAELGIDCEWERRPAFTYVTSDERVDQVRAEAEAAVRAGLPASFVTNTDLPCPVAGAVRVGDQAQYHPRRHLFGLADAIIEQGGIIHAQTRVRRLVEGVPCRLTADDGSTDPQGMYITPEENTRSVRTAPYATGRRLLIATGESFTPGAGGRVTARYERLTAWARERFDIDDIAYQRAAQDNHTG